MRYGIALLVVVVDLVTVAVPLGSFFLAYVLLARPAWFLRWLTQEVYRDA